MKILYHFTDDENYFPVLKSGVIENASLSFNGNLMAFFGCVRFAFSASILKRTCEIYPCVYSYHPEEHDGTITIKQLQELARTYTNVPDLDVMTARFFFIDHKKIVIVSDKDWVFTNFNVPKNIKEQVDKDIQFMNEMEWYSPKIKLFF